MCPYLPQTPLVTRAEVSLHCHGQKANKVLSGAQRNPAFSSSLACRWLWPSQLALPGIFCHTHTAPCSHSDPAAPLWGRARLRAHPGKFLGQLLKAPTPAVPARGATAVSLSCPRAEDAAQIPPAASATHPCLPGPCCHGDSRPLRISPCCRGDQFCLSVARPASSSVAMATAPSPLPCCHGSSILPFAPLPR